MFWAALHMVISDFKVFIVFVAPFPQVHLSVWGGGGGGGGGQQASSLSSKHKLWNFHRYSATGLESRFFVFWVLRHILLSIS